MMGDDEHSMDFTTKDPILSHPFPRVLCINGVLCDLSSHIPDAGALHRYQYITGILVFHRP